MRLPRPTIHAARAGLLVTLAAALILFPTCRDHSDVTTGPSQVTASPGILLDSLSRSTASQVSSDSLFATVRILAGDSSFVSGGQSRTIASRYSTDRSHPNAILYIESRLNSFGLTATEQTFGTTGKNIVAVQTGTTDPSHFVLIGAHYDSMPADTIAPGADDNGSGVAATLEVARVLSSVPTSRSIIYAFWDQEEQGLKGSAAYAAQAAGAGKIIDGVVNLDMIGYDGDGDLNLEVHVNGTAASTVVADSLLHANLVCGLPLTLSVINPGTQASDHASFWRNSYGALLLIEEYYGHDFNPYYHSRNDRISAFSPVLFTSATRLAAATILRMAVPHAVSGALTRR
jgi:Zn-dependent M28 family amino/carboxypeptidase